MSATSPAITTPLAANADRATSGARWWHPIVRSRRTVIGLIVVLSTIALTLLAPVIDRYDPNFGNFDDLLARPSGAHIFGTDNFGRDVFARVLWGYRVSLTVGIVSVVAAVIAGVPIGLLAGYFGNPIDNILMRPLDLLMSFPAIMLAITLVAIFGTKTSVTILALAMIYFPIMARVLRGSVITVRGEEYVEAARSIGAKPLRVMLRHVLPNSLGPLVVQASISMGIAILIEASLAFIGLSTQPPDPSLGGMLYEGRDFMREAPWVVTFPGLAIMLAVLGFNLLGDGLRDVIAPERS